MPEGTKNDSSKLRYDLINPYPLEELAAVYTYGAEKYGDRNYLNGMRWSRIIGAMLRHIQAFRGGEANDAEGFKHLAAVAWGAFTLMEYEEFDIGEDDRWPYDEGEEEGRSDEEPRFQAFFPSDTSEVERKTAWKISQDGFTHYQSPQDLTGHLKGQFASRCIQCYEATESR